MGLRQKAPAPTIDTLKPKGSNYMPVSGSEDALPQVRMLMGNLTALATQHPNTAQIQTHHLDLFSDYEWLTAHLDEYTDGEPLYWSHRASGTTIGHFACAMEVDRLDTTGYALRLYRIVFERLRSDIWHAKVSLILDTSEPVKS